MTYRALHEDSKTSNYDSNLNSSSPKTSTSGDKLHLERVASSIFSFTPWNGAPPLIFIEGSHSFHGREFSSFLLEPTSSSNEELPRQNLKVVGPMGWSADQGGQPTTLLGRPTFSFFGWVALGVHLSMVKVWALVMLNFFSGGPFDLCEACVAISDWSMFAI